MKKRRILILRKKKQKNATLKSDISKNTTTFSVVPYEVELCGAQAPEPQHRLSKQHDVNAFAWVRSQKHAAI